MNNLNCKYIALSVYVWFASLNPDPCFSCAVQLLGSLVPRRLAPYIVSFLVVFYVCNSSKDGREKTW